jgi:nucleotide-binding universal stress UspA family protein
LQHSFENILLPIDLDANTELAVKKTTELVRSASSTIHLLHIMRPGGNHISSYDLISTENYPEHREKHSDRLEQMKGWSKIIRRLMPNSEVLLHLTRGGSIENVVIEKALETDSQLIIIAKQSGKKWLRLVNPVSPTDIARETHSGVLIVKPGSFYNKIKSIVLPVRSFIPLHKVDMLFPLVYHKGITIYLVSILDTEADSLDLYLATHALNETYRILKEEAVCHIIYKQTKPNNMATTLLDFAASVQADLLMVNPDEADVWSLTGMLDVSDLLASRSSLQVMAVDRSQTFNTQ